MFGLNKDKYITQSMVVGNNRKFISALIVPDWDEVRSYLKGNNFLFENPDKLAKDEKIIKLFQFRMDNRINNNLSDFEKIRKFKIIISEFTQERAELTPTLKLRRHVVLEHYKKEIEEIYNS